MFYNASKFFVVFAYDEEGSIQEYKEFDNLDDAISCARENDLDIYRVSKLIY